MNAYKMSKNLKHKYQPQTSNLKENNIPQTSNIKIKPEISTQNLKSTSNPKPKTTQSLHLGAWSGQQIVILFASCSKDSLSDYLS